MVPSNEIISTKYMLFKYMFVVVPTLCRKKREIKLNSIVNNKRIKDHISQ